MSKQNIVVVDIDGTLAKVGERLKYLQQKSPDWDAFYNSCFDDEPITEVVDLVKNLAGIYHIIYCTGRREQVRDITYEWLEKHSLPDGHLLMRPNGDTRHDTSVKPAILFSFLEKHDREKGDIAFILEDRCRVVELWRSLGIKCLQVAKGDY